LVNVSYEIEDEKTLKREISALVEGMKYFKLDRAYLVTAVRDEVIEVDVGVIEVIPMWKWLLLGE
jgi:predicted AAA+ superfamily ATPase